MEQEFFIGQCLICQQGMLEIAKDKKTGNLYIYCYECETQWDTPQDALQNTNALWDQYVKQGTVSMQDIETRGWDSFLIP